MEVEITEEILNYFKGREDHCARQEVGQSFRPLERPITDGDFRQVHLYGDACFGFYLMREDNTVYCTCVDFDNHDDHPDPDWRKKADATFFFLQQQGYEPVMELSQSGKGAHVWLFFEEPVPAWLTRKFWKSVALKVGITFKEIYPRQDVLRGKGLGNLIRYPYWNHSKFVDPENDWRQIGFGSPAYTSRGELEDSCVKFGVSPKPPEDIAQDASGLPAEIGRLLMSPTSTFYRRWNQVWDESFLANDPDTSESAVVFYFTQELVYQRVHTDVIRKAIKYWCSENNYSKGENDVWVETVINNAYDSVNNRLAKSDQPAETIIDCAQSFLNTVGNNFYYGSGIKALDASIDGVGSGEVAIVAARPGHGKSALAIQWLISQGMQNVNTLMLNAEMSAREIGKRIIMWDSPNKDDEYLKANKAEIMNAVKQKWENKGKVFYRPVGTIDDVEENIRFFVEHKQVQLVAVDYLQLLRSTATQGRYETVTDISQRIKGAARDNDIAIIALCQVSREVEKRDKVSFQGSDLRESGQLEQDADLIMFCWSHLKVTNASNPKRYDIHIVKRRNGPIRKQTVHIEFSPSEQRFYG